MHKIGGYGGIHPPLKGPPYAFLCGQKLDVFHPVFGLKVGNSFNLNFFNLFMPDVWQNFLDQTTKVLRNMPDIWYIIQTCTLTLNCCCVIFEVLYFRSKKIKMVGYD